MKYLLGISLLVTTALTAVGQNAFLPLDFYSTMRAERSMVDSVQSLHPEIRPYSAWVVQDINGMFLNGSAKRIRTKAKERKENYFEIELAPRINTTGYYEVGDANGTAVESSVGAAVFADYANKVKFSADVIAGYNEPVSYMSVITDSLHAVPGYSYANRQGGFGYHQSTINLAWRPSKVVELNAGRGKHFIGEGYRSLFLSDYAPNYNFLRADITAWRIKYMLLYTQMRSSLGFPDKFYGVQNKYATMHYLSLNITKWWSVGAFEAVVWESEDSAQIRQVDINYLNPIIFFRPVEYSLGSSDNSLLGFSSTIRPAKGLTLYGQVMIDEFIVKEVFAPINAKISSDSTIKTAWYGNKQAVQLGIKVHEPFGWKHSTILAEFNVLRPYIYSHGNSNQSYTHMTQPLAHPLGANAIEWVAVAAWQPKDVWHFSLRSTYSRKGYTTSTRNMGEEPMISSSFLINSPEKHGYYLLQGKIVDVANVRVDAAYTLVERWNLRVESSLHYRVERSSSHMLGAFIFGFGLRTALWNDYKML